MDIRDRVDAMQKALDLDGLLELWDAGHQDETWDAIAEVGYELARDEDGEEPGECPRPDVPPLASGWEGGVNPDWDAMYADELYHRDR